ncbi:Pentafunctional AROM polypeptide [Hondaea fermentalgiana]|uniref:3-dehydroquinate synthase n=1 Tax=Hondaea fermentalgiana TaxID=2315210 RepID=A0A2R5GNM1_9STRA|nr:Pentafunctional AROM polypeptide [Hondaea fermentalgiana]|eukprot:GBG31899.1 Pentafunctional AROM polypeptide [Hondaea fermentalgiana]
MTSTGAVQVDLGDRSYPIEFRPIKEIGATLAGLHKPGKCVVVTNDVVGPLYGQIVQDSLRSAGWAPEYIELEDGEAKKTTDTYIGLVNRLLELQVDRKTPVVAVGGGVTTDIAGFAAATTMRGLPFANVPTTLLAQVDASVGGKTGVNTSHGKNLLGAFWQPFLVHVAVDALDTLSDPEYRCGLGEVVKHAVLEEKQDPSDPSKWVPSTEFFEWLEANAEAIVARDQEALKHTVRRCCEIKAAVVSQDERESGKRALLNLGHTVGHAVEAVVGYGGLRHGEAVAMGTVAETHLAVLRGCCDASVPERIASLLRKLQLPTGLEGLKTDDLVKASFMDKKREQAHITVTMPHSIGDVRLVKITPEELIPAFESLTTNAGSADAAREEDASSKGGAGNGGASNGEANGAAPPSPPSANSFASGAHQNSENFMTGRPTTRVHQPPGGASSIIFG